MEVGMDIEDDLFFEDLNKQISLLIMDDDDPLAHTTSSSLQVFSRAIYPGTQPPLVYHQTCTRSESKGTGVFIPQSSSNRRRRNIRQARQNSSKYHKQQNQNSRGIINNSHGSNYMNLPPHQPFSTKKHVDYR